MKRYFISAAFIALALLIVLPSPAVAQNLMDSDDDQVSSALYAKNGDDDTHDDDRGGDRDDDSDDDRDDDRDDDSRGRGSDDGPFDDRNDDSRSSSNDQALRSLKLQRDQVERDLIQLRAAFTALSVSQTEERENLRRQIVEKEALKDTLKLQIEQEKSNLKSTRRSLYSDDEWREGLRLQTLLNNSGNMRALPLNSIIILDRPVKFDTPPVIKSGRTLIPVNGVALSLGAQVSWDDDDDKVIIRRGNDIIEFEINDDSMKVNGRSVNLEVPAQIINNRTVIPLRALIESMNLSVEWDPATETIVISE